MSKSVTKSKTRKAAAKRFKITARGKIIRTRSSRRHLLECKSGKRKRQLAKGALVHDSDVARVKECLLFS